MFRALTVWLSQSHRPPLLLLLLPSSPSLCLVRPPLFTSPHFRLPQLHLTHPTTPLSDSVMKRATAVARKELISLGINFGRFNRKGDFKLQITALTYLAPYALVRRGRGAPSTATLLNVPHATTPALASPRHSTRSGSRRRPSSRSCTATTCSRAAWRE